MNDPKLSQKPLIAILLGAPFTEQNYKRTGVPYLKESFDVIVLDCNPWLRVGFQKLSFIEYNYPSIIKINTSDDFVKIIVKLQPKYAIDFLGLGEYTFFIQNILQTYGVRIVLQRTGTLPTPSRIKIFLALLKNNPPQLWQRLSKKIGQKQKKWKIIAPHIALVAGRKSLDRQTLTAEKKLWIGSQDYYTYKMVESNLAQTLDRNVARSNYIVFIDSGIALGSDAILLGLPYFSQNQIDNYYISLQNAFDIFEKITGWSVKVAAHSSVKVIEEKYRNLFGRRDVYDGMTAQLIQHSQLVLSHASTALSYAVLWEKPIILLMMSKDLDLFAKKYFTIETLIINQLSIELDGPLLFLEAHEREYLKAYQKSKPVNREKYAEYVDNYIRSKETVEESIWQEFSSLVKQEQMLL
ncbi:hypothetical protein NG799_19650 [Laspinema sp. D1]|uniref:Uncharacterized protein n=1 Tax=Laspinema palackyanum D2a TaxID=2953684 RepID=A0ABT2MYR3_9CYAN|nr:hypothetical protein [Laspinema sp. D2a]